MSLKGDKYETLEEINFRLANTVVLYEGKPVYITRVAMPEAEDKKEIARVFFVELPHKDLAGLAIPRKLGGLRLDVEDIKPQGKEQRKYLSSKNFDLAPFKMGYFNFDDRAVFVSRNPVRQNRQGLSRENTVFSNIKGNKDDGMDFGTMLKSQGFVDMVNGKFPDFKQVGDMLGNNENSSVAVSRCFAFHIDHDLEVLHLLHKGTRCGIAIKGDKALRIPPKFHFLRQEAEECRIPLA